MCDFSLQQVKSRPAKVADKLTTKNFGFGTVGLCAADDASVAVCILPGTELAFAEPLTCRYPDLPDPAPLKGRYMTAIFRQIKKDQPMVHHDSIEFPDGASILLNHLAEDQEMTVLQLPAQPKTEAEAKEQKRVVVIGWIHRL